MSTLTLHPAEPALVPELSPASPTRTQRRPLLDVARLVAAFAIVWLHTPQSPELMASGSLGRFAVPFFTAAATFLVWQSVARKPTQPFAAYARGRFQRLYVPFLVWTAVYLLFKFAKRAVAPDQANDFPGWEVLVTGGFYHLWFLPFIFVVSLATFLVARMAVINPRREAFTAQFAAATASALLWLPMTRVEAFGPTASYWITALPAALGGVALAIVDRLGADNRLTGMKTTWISLAIAIVATLIVWPLGRNLAAENIAGVAFLVFALGRFDTPWLTKLAPLGALAYGIYLSHMLFVKTCEALAAKLHLTPSAGVDLATFAIAATGSLALTWALSKSRYTRWTVV